MTTLLIATHNNLIAVRFEEGSDSITIAHLESGYRYYGIALTPHGRLYVAKNTRNVEDVTKIVDILTGEELEFEVPLKDVHQITYANNGLYITNTYNNGVVYKSLENGDEHTYTIGGVFENDYAHPNSLWVDGEYVYVLLHNQRFRASEIARLRHNPKEGFDIGFRSEIRYKIPHSCCHNIRFDRGLLTYVASEDSTLAQIDFLTGRSLRRLPLKEASYAKGMATKGSRLFVACNELVPHTKRYESNSWLWLYDDFKGIGERHEVELKLPNGEPVGNVNEIRIVPDNVLRYESKDD